MKRHTSRLLTLLPILFFFFAPGARAATDYYYAVTAQGSGTGTSCGNAYAYNDPVNGWNQAAKQGPDVVTHLCVVFTFPANTTAITVATAGTSGHPYTIKFETGAGLQAPYWPGNTNGALTAAAVGAIVSNVKSYVVIDGGTNGFIKSTANGTVLANQQPSYGVYVSACTAGCVVQNLNIGPMYQHLASPNDENGGNSAGVVVIGSNANPAAVTVQNNTITGAMFDVVGIYAGANSMTSLSIHNNSLSDANECIRVGDGNGGSSTSAGAVRIFANQFQDCGKNWDETADDFHHNCVHIFAANSGSTLNNPWLYSNVCKGNNGANENSFFYVEPTGGGAVPNPYFFNNFILSTGPVGTASYGTINVQGTNPVIVNNTVVGYTTSQSHANACVNFGSATLGVTWRNNTCQNFGLAILWTGTSTFTSVSNNNYFQLGGFGNNGSFVPLTTWQSASGGDATPPSTLTNPNVQTVAPYTPNAGSTLIGTGANLTSLCGTIAPLCTDINGVSRPSSGPWDRGAAQADALSIPGVPTGLGAVASNSTINLSWTPSTGTVSGYTVRRSTVSGGQYVQIATNITTTSYADTNLAAGTYFYVVSAFNSAGSSANSTQASATVQPAVTVPGTPASLSATVSGTSVALAWAAALGTPVNYIVKRSTVTGGPYSTIATLGLVTTYTDSNLANGTYFYVVAASNSAGSSGNSPQATAVVSVAPAASLLPASAIFGQVIQGQTAQSCGTAPNCVITLTNRGTANLVLAGSNAVTLSGANAADFTIFATNCTNSLSIAPNAFCTITLTFTPSSIGTETASLVVASNDPNSPDSVALSGVGVGPVSISPSSLSFGNVFKNKPSSTKTVTFTNSSGVTQTFSSVAIATGDNTQFSVFSDGCSPSVANGASCNVSVVFQPSGSGTKNSKLRFIDTAGTQDVNLSGNGSNRHVFKVSTPVEFADDDKAIHIVLTAASAIRGDR